MYKNYRVYFGTRNDPNLVYKTDTTALSVEEAAKIVSGSMDGFMLISVNELDHTGNLVHEVRRPEKIELRKRRAETEQTRPARQYSKRTRPVLSFK